MSHMIFGSLRKSPLGVEFRITTPIPVFTHRYAAQGGPAVTTLFAMHSITTKLAIAALGGLATLAGVAGPAAAQTDPAQRKQVTIYENEFEARGQVNELTKSGDAKCTSKLSKKAAAITVGKNTNECAYRTPIIAREVDIAAEATLDAKTPKNLQNKVFLSVYVRAGDTGAYQLAVYPGRKQWVLSSISGTGDGAQRTVVQEKEASFIRKPGKENRLRLRAFASSIIGSVNGHQVVRFDDPNAAALTGRNTLVSVGSTKPVAKAVGLFDTIDIGVPDPDSP